MEREIDGGIQAVKVARNQALWREVNEKIRLVAETSENMEFLCECADLECTQTLNLTVAEYERIRSSGVRFPIAIGHDFPEFENVVEENEGYVVVEKIGIAAEEAEKLDPRSPGPVSDSPAASADDVIADFEENTAPIKVAPAAKDG